MNLLEQIKQKALQAKNAISNVFGGGNSMSFPTTSEALSKSTQIGKNEEAKGYYGKQDNSIINSPLLGEIKNKVGLNYEDAQVNAWREGLKVNPQLAAKMGNNPAFADVDLTGGLQSVGKKVEKQLMINLKPIDKSIPKSFYNELKDEIKKHFQYETLPEKYQSYFSKKELKQVFKHIKDREERNIGFGVEKYTAPPKIVEYSDITKKIIDKLKNSKDPSFPNKELNANGSGRYLYHGTNLKNLDSIRKNGLIPSGEVYNGTVDFTDTPFDAARWSNRFDRNNKNLILRLDDRNIGKHHILETSDSIISSTGKKINPELLQYSVDNGKTWVNLIENQPKSIFQGFKDISTKLLEDLKGKSIVPKSYIEQRLVSSDLNLKQVEKDLIRSKLANYPDRFDVSEFAENIKTDLLPLKVNNLKNGEWITGSRDIASPKYEHISLPQELRGNIQNYSEHIYESPIKTSAGQIHFPGRTQNYFGHTRVEDLADSSLDKALRKPGGTRRVIEVQSDLYQKGRLEKENPYFGTDELASLNNKMDMIRSNPNYTPEVKTIEREKIQNAINKIRDSRKKEISKLEQYNDPTAHFRMVREEVKQAALDGKTKLQFPTGETAMKIEGLGGTKVDFYHSYNGIKPIDAPSGEVTKNSLKNGLQIEDRNGDDWIITEVLEDGKFKAVPKSLKEDIIEEFNFRSSKEEGGDGQLFSQLSKKEQDDYLKEAYYRDEEQFDISGKVDTNNPIYKFYEKDLGKYLTSKFNAKQITDERGVKWYELEVKPEFKDKPVEAFGFSTPGQILKTTGKLGLGLGVGTAGLAYKGALDKINQDTDSKKKELEQLKTKLEELKNKQPKTYDEKLEYVIPRLKVEIDSKGQIKGYGNTLAADNNNPGNLRFAGQKNATQGRGGFAKFETPQLGFRALIKQVQKDQSRDLTLEQFVHKYSPPSENDTVKYIKFLEDKLDVKKSEKINKIPSFKLAEQVAMFESQTKISY